MISSNKRKRNPIRKEYALVLALVAAVILAILGAGLLQICLGVRVRASKLKRETVSMLAAEAGYEQGIFWMSQQDDVLTGLSDGDPGSSGTINFTDSKCEYEVQFYDFIGSRPVFRIISTGYSGSASRAVDVYVMQKITGWDMGICRIPNGTTSTAPVNFAGGEIINIPVHINKDKDRPNERDIYISGGSPQFLDKVEMGESRYAGATDLYSGIMGYFQGGITFDQPNVKITDEDAVQSKLNRFRDTTDPSFIFTPVGTADIPNPLSAVQLEFFIDSSIGYVRITNNCTVRGANPGEYDYCIVPGTNGTQYQKYSIYGYHYKPDDPNEIITVPIENTYVTQKFSGIESEPGGQIFVDGNVIIGSAEYNEMVVEGKLTIVATGNIWIGDNIKVSEPLHGGTYVPIKNNESVLGLISQRVIKVIDPGFSDNFGTLDPVEDLVVGAAKTHSYAPVANGSNMTTNVRYLPDPVIVIAALTVGGGGWGAENVGMPGRKEYDGNQDDLIVIGSICEAVRGVVGLVGTDGFIKKYTIDERLLEGVLPGNIWFGGKYVPAPAGWHDYRVSD